MDSKLCGRSQLKRPLALDDEQEPYRRKWRDPGFSNHNINSESESTTRGDRNNVASMEASDDVSMSETLGADRQMIKARYTDTENISEEMCYGMLCEGKAAFLDGFNLDWDAFNNLLGSPFLDDPLSLSYKDGAYSVRHDRTAADIAILDTHMSDRLQDITKVGIVRIRGFVDPSTEVTSTTSTPPMFQIFLVLYGKKSISSAVGKILSRSRVFLQHPIQFDRSIKYENPHYYKTAKSNVKTTLTGRNIGVPTIQENVSPQSVIEEVLQTLEQDIPQREFEPGVWIKTQLLPHQKEALHFILERENWAVTKAISLWKLNGTPTRPFYQHSITGMKKESHSGDSLGGILADEMGLGKTLSLVAAIVTTLDEAQLHGSDIQNQRNKSLQSKSTLVLVPSIVLLDGWVAEIERHVQENTLKVYKYHGQGKNANFHNLLNYDLVLTTFATLSAECSKGRSPLQKINWFRLVLDEAHFVRNQKTEQFKAVLSLKAQRRWLLSGTPVQNSMEDLGALIRILRVPELENKSTFHKYIIAPLAKGIPDNRKNLRLLLNSVCLRRPATILNLPAITYLVQDVELSAEERELYEEILDSSSQEIEEAISSNKSFVAYSTILRAILRTRMLCNHGTFRTGTGTNRVGTPSMEKNEVLAYMQDGDEEMKLATLDSPPASGSQREHCTSDPDTQTRGFLSSSAAFVRSGHSTKLSILMKNLKNEKSKGKSIVFSSWKKTLDLAEPLLRSNEIKYVRIDGNVIGTERSNIITKFDTDPSITVIMMTTGTGAVGLNLTVATQVHILEPQWNPCVESQAIGRVLRLTQSKPVTVTRYITHNTVEQAVQERRNKKMELAELTLNSDMDSDIQLSQRLYNLRSLLRK